MCDPSVAFNGETWFIARAFRIAREELGLRAILSYADPLERRTATGDVVKPQHWGTIYQASNAIFGGRAEPRTLIIAPDGTTVNGRALTKIRKQERGVRYAMEQLIAKGAPAPVAGEDPRLWLQRALADWQRVRHEGNLAYVFGLNRKEAQRLRALHNGGKPYLKSAA